MFEGRVIDENEVAAKIPIFWDVNKKTIQTTKEWEIYSNNGFGKNFNCGNLKLANVKVDSNTLTCLQNSLVRTRTK